jgi:hypothetical protein
MTTNPIWKLQGPPSAPGWFKLQMDDRSDSVDLLHFDQDRWALVRAPEPPDQYEGLEPVKPADGLYLDNHGRPCYVLDAVEVVTARAVVKGLGQEAEELYAKFGDGDLVLERLGRAF